MALGSDFNALCPIFDFNNGGGVLFPYFPMSLAQTDSNLPYVDLDGASLSATLARIRLPMVARLVTCEAFAVSDDAGLKGATCSVEPVIGIVFGTYPLASVGLGTSIGVITCEFSGDIGHKWAGTTTVTEIATTEEIIIYLKTAALGTASGHQDGGAVPILWFAAVNGTA